MPFRASLHFYVVPAPQICGGESMCQCPSGLSFISTRDERQCSCTVFCVNALLGFPSFLRYFFMPSHLRWFFVSMPFWAFLHFYRTCSRTDTESGTVSMPFWAFLHFYSILLEPAEIKHFPGLFCRYLSENSENKVFQIVFCTVHNLFIF